MWPFDGPTPKGIAIPSRQPDVALGDVRGYLDVGDLAGRVCGVSPPSVVMAGGALPFVRRHTAAAGHRCVVYNRVLITVRQSPWQ